MSNNKKCFSIFMVFLPLLIVQRHRKSRQRRGLMTRNKGFWLESNQPPHCSIVIFKPQCFEKKVINLLHFVATSPFTFSTWSWLLSSHNVWCIKCVLFECVGRGTQSRFLQDSEVVHRQGKHPKHTQSLDRWYMQVEGLIEGLHVLHVFRTWETSSNTCRSQSVLNT